MCVVLFGAAAEAKVYESYDDVLKSGDKADIEAMQAALEKAGYDSDKLQLDGPPPVFAWLTAPANIEGAPPRFIPYEGSGTVSAGGYPFVGGTFSWTCGEWSADTGTSYSAGLPGFDIGGFTLTVTYTVQGLGCNSADGNVVFYAADVDIDGIADGDPEDPDPNDTEAITGALIGWEGARKKITLAGIPASAFPEEEPVGDFFWTATLGTSGSGQIEFWTAEEDGDQVANPYWYGHVEGGPWSSLPIPSELWVQGVGSGDVDVTFTCSVDDHYYTSGSYGDTVKFTVMEAQLDADGLDNADEEDPGAYLGVGATRRMYVRKPMPTDPLLPTDKVKLSWTNDSAVDVWDNVDKTGAIDNGHEFEISDLTEGDGHSVRAIWVEGVEASSDLRDVVFTLRYMREGAQTEDVVKFTVVQADLDIDGLSEEQEDAPGGFVGRRRDGNEAPRKKITIRPVSPSGWSGTVNLSGGGGKLSAYATEEGTTDVLAAGGLTCSTGDLPKELWVQGDAASSAMRDATLTLAPSGITGGGDTVKFTVVDVDLDIGNGGNDLDNGRRTRRRRPCCCPRRTRRTLALTSSSTGTTMTRRIRRCRTLRRLLLRTRTIWRR